MHAQCGPVPGLLAGLLAASSFVRAQDSVSFNYDTYAQDASDGATPYQTYLSNAVVKPPQLQINANFTGRAPGFVFVGVDGEPASGQNWPVIYDMSEERIGTLVWTANYSEPFDFRVQTYKGEPVITFWTGTLLNGYGHGSYTILNQSYVEIAHFSAIGYTDLSDLHEFSITSNDTALVIVYHAVQADLTALGAADDAWIFECTFQELNIETGDLIFEWNASNHVGINETYNTITDVGTEDAPFDWFHMNSVQKDSDGNYLVSGRVMDTLYKVSGSDGSIVWKLNGKNSNFAVDFAASFAYQHHARWINDEQTRLTIFDNGPTDGVSYSRGLLLSVDQDKNTVSLIQEFTNINKTFAEFEGNLQAIDASNETTNYFLGFGSQPFFTELNSDGNVLLDVQFGKTNTVNGYRSRKLEWQGKPITKPDIFFNSTTNTTYFSWNGATDTATWTVYTANTTNTTDWTNVTSARRTGFETVIHLSNMDLGTYVRGAAVNLTGGILGWTRASDGTRLYDSPDGNTTSSTTTSTSSTTSTSTTTSITPSITPMSSSSVSSASPVSTTTAAAAKFADITEQIYLVAVVAIGGLLV